MAIGWSENVGGDAPRAALAIIPAVDVLGSEAEDLFLVSSTLVLEPLVPIALDTARVIRLDHMHEGH